MLYEYIIENRKLQTGDIISTKDGDNSIYSLGFTILGKIIPGEADHTVIYLGPQGLCVEAGLHGVIIFNAGPLWGSNKMARQRFLRDTFYAASSIFAGRFFPAKDEEKMRLTVRGYVLGSVGKPYNLNLLERDTERAVYCSQLAYLAYKQVGIDLSVRKPGVTYGKLLDRIVLPQDVLDNSRVIEQL